jgi:transposase
MKRFIQSEDRTQGMLLPEQLDDYVTEDNPVRVVDIFVGRPAYHPAVLLKLYI